MSIGENIREARLKAGLTQKQLGERIGITAQSVAQWETGRREPKLKSLEKIADALHVSLASIYGLSEDKTNAVEIALFDSELNDGKIDKDVFDERLWVELSIDLSFDIQSALCKSETLLKWTNDDLISITQHGILKLNRAGLMVAAQQILDLAFRKEYMKIPDEKY